jgi:transcriptional regulator with XRE-family HTH domain
MQAKKTPTAIFSSRLQRRMNDLSLNQVSLSKAIGVSQNAIWKWIQGKSHPAGIVTLKLARALQVTPEYLLGATDDPTQIFRPADNISTCDVTPPRDTSLREPPPTYRMADATALQPLCRFPADCDLTERLTSMESALVTMSAQVQTLTQLLGATLAASTHPVAPSVAGGERNRKAG